MNPDDVCAGCGHERYFHWNFQHQPVPCQAKDLGEQCHGFVEPAPDAHRRRADQLTRLVEEMLAHECAQFPSAELLRKAMAAGVAIPKHLERYL